VKVDGRRALRAFVRGESSWRDLLELGLQIDFGPQLHATVPAEFPIVRPNLIDVAAGLISQADDTARREWAGVFLAIGSIDTTGLEQEKDWPTLLEAIWDASGGKVSEASLEFARTLIVGPRLEH
jgi:hypothetical protein